MACGDFPPWGLGYLKISKGHPNEAEVTEVYKDEEVRRHVVYLTQEICSMRQPDMGSFVDNYYSLAKFQAAYAGIIPSIVDRNQWPEVDKGFTLHPPIQKKKEPGRLRKNRIKPARETGGKATRQVRCPNCREYGHRASSWKCYLTGTKKRKRTKKKPTKVGRKKKAKTTAAAAEQTTPRTRGALAREAAAKAKEGGRRSRTEGSCSKGSSRSSSKGRG
ncbi:hypothetical protein C2845_PM15G01210 [Panicum miliaceum]|uniref:Uncharacterized protein n=1 Tax=Panicum miliaceum TaxID=4540 RepID=A0A3L6QB36_PANMI|nr:hypothetical protein C2845_PM15G01210 [Panicum miliaceum]